MRTAVRSTGPAPAQQFASGQFGYTPNITQPPVIAPPKTGLQCTPPPAFKAPPATGNTGSMSKPAEVDCVLR